MIKRRTYKKKVKMKEPVLSVSGLSLSDKKEPSSKAHTTGNPNKASQAVIIQNNKNEHLGEFHTSQVSPSAPVNMTLIDQTTIIFFQSIKEGSIATVKTLLRGKQIGPNTRDLNDFNAPTALIAACEANNTEIVKLLLTIKKAKSIDVNQEDKAGRRPIWIAAWKGNSEIADLLLNSRGTECDVNFIDKDTGTSPLYRAILSNSAEVAQLLIHAKADVNMRRMGLKMAETPLIKAVQLNNKQIVELLVNGLCKIQARTVDGFNALHYAVAYKRYDIVAYLLENGIKIHAKSNNGITPMTVAIEHHNPPMVKLLIEYGYRMDKHYKWKETPLSQAINLHSEEAAMTLIHQGCEMKKRHGNSYFYMAVDEKLMRLMKFMAAVNPQFLQEEWIQTKNWPVSIYHRPDIIRWLEQESQKVRTLRQLCRGKIFRLLGKYPPTKIKKLKLEESLAVYLSYTSHVKDEFFVQQALSVATECPIECPAICSRKYCPPIEFLSSSESGSSIDDDEISSQNVKHHNGHHDHETDKCCDYCK